jgi:transcriptional regulator with PAS, ATPase and Fis domain
LSLLLRAYDALDQGILVVSHTGLISYYNTAYAQLRNLTLQSLIGQPLETIDRRGDLRALLRSGRLPATKPAAYELRQNRETLLPLVDQGRLVGGMVLVTRGEDRQGKSSRRQQIAKTPWGAQYSTEDIIGNSLALTYARDLAMKAAQGNSPVLLLGESGTGKELFAHAIHMASPRHAQPLVPVDCSAISRELLEAELFGYAPGAFTGATKEGKPGKFELADGGTVFLDEIGEMPLEMQAKLLRVLQERRVVRVGGTSPTPVDFRVIAATNRDLDSMVAEKRFRQDLLYRLDVIRIEIPALRERPEDIPLLLKHAWERKSRELGITSVLSAKAVQALNGYLWPGNMRELLNMVERLLVSIPKPIIGPEDLPMYVKRGQTQSFPDAPSLYLKTVVAEAEQHALEKALQHAQGNRNTAAELVGLSRASFYRKLKEYGLTHSLRDQDAYDE